MNSPGCRRRRAGLGLPPPASLLAESATGELAPSLPPPSVDPRRSPPTTANPLRPVHLPPPLHAVRQAASTPPGLGLSAIVAAAGHAPPPQGLGNSLPPGGIRRLTATPPWRGSAAGADSSPAPFPSVSTAGARPPSVLSLTCAHKMIVLACYAERRKDEVGEVLSAPRQFYTRSCC